MVPCPTALPRRLAPALLAAALIVPLPAAANESEARDVARGANCQPGKVVTLRQIPGTNGETVLKVNCSGGRNLFVLVQCRVRQCVLLR